MDSLRIETAQNVIVHHEVASVGDRILAFLIDFLIVLAWYIIWMMIAAIVDANEDTVTITLIVIGSIPWAFYHLVSELVMDGQSIGKAVRKIKVARKDGGQPTLGQYLLRWLLRIIDVWFYGLGLLVMLINGRGQRLGDLAAGTTVVSLKQRVTLRDTMMTDVLEAHQVRFPEVVRLTDAQAAMIKEVLNNTQVVNRWALVEEIAEKVRRAIGNPGEGLKPMEFLRAVLEDYVHITSQQGAGTGHYKGERPKTN
jgi:uncharacterized RDD family membrane protein YckC